MCVCVAGCYQQSSGWYSLEVVTMTAKEQPRVMKQMRQQKATKHARAREAALAATDGNENGNKKNEIWKRRMGHHPRHQSETSGGGRKEEARPRVARCVAATNRPITPRRRAAWATQVEEAAAPDPPPRCRRLPPPRPAPCSSAAAPCTRGPHSVSGASRPSPAAPQS